MEIEYRENCLSPEDFIRLRIAVGRVATPLPQAEAALRAGLYNVTAFCVGKAIGMGRLVGDGAMYWYIQDMAVLPEYQGEGNRKKHCEKTASAYIPAHLRRNFYHGRPYGGQGQGRLL